MLYHFNELKEMVFWPASLASRTVNNLLEGWDSEEHYHRFIKASTALLERTTKTFPKPLFSINSVERDGKKIDIIEKVAQVKPFCVFKKFQKVSNGEQIDFEDDPIVLIVAPLSGHYATLLRDTVRAMLPYHTVYITDWRNTRHVDMKWGDFSLDNYIDYLLDFLRFMGKPIHVMAVCQPSVPVLAAASLLAEYKEPCQPKSLILMGGPIDTRINPGKVNKFSQEHSIHWFQRNLIATVPRYYEGSGRKVCPGFIMLSGFMSLNLERHQEASFKLFNHLIKGDMESAEAHKKFYNEYRAVMDLPASYFLQSIEMVFQKYSLPKGEMFWRGYRIQPELIKQTALMTIEGELDDISCPGQTAAAHDLCRSLPDKMRRHHFQKNVGHYGLFNGRRWRSEVQPIISKFITEFD